MKDSNYWSRMTKATISRRALMRSAAAIGAGAAGMALVGCGGNGEKTAGVERTAVPEGTPRPGGTWRVGTEVDLLGMDPHLGIMQVVGGRIHGHLFTVSFRDQSMLMELAESFEQPDETTYVWKLRPGVRFQDIDPTFGREVTADDAVYSFQRRRDDPNSQSDRSFLQKSTAGFEALDRYTFRLRTNRPYSPALNELGDLSYAIVPREAVDKWGDLNTNAAGCGGYILKEFVRGERVEMVRNPDFFIPGRPYLDGIEWLRIPDQGSLLEAFKTGRLDSNPPGGAATLDKIRIDELRRIDGIEVFEAPNFWKPALVLKVDKAPFNDIRVRRALDLAVERDDLTNRIFLGDALLDGPLVWGLEYWALPQAELQNFYRHDPQEAKQLLAAAGYGDGLDVDVKLVDIFYLSEMATVVKEQFAKVGVHCDLELQELGIWLSQTAPGNYEATWFLNMPYEDPDRPLLMYFSEGPLGGWNQSGYNNPRMDEWIWKERSEFDPEKRRQIILDAQREALQEHAPQLNMSSPHIHGAQWDRVKGGDPYIGRWDYLGLDVWMT